MSFDISDLKLPNNIKLADKNFNKSTPIDLLLGANLFFDILCVGQIKLGNNKPIIQKTKLGWIISGALHLPKYTDGTVVCNLATIDQQLHEQVKQFWILEELNGQKCLSKEELECEQHCMRTFKRDSNGRLEVSLPLKNNSMKLGEFERIATDRCLALERRLQRNAELKTRYEDFMDEYESLGHMSVVDTCDNRENTFKILFTAPRRS